MPSSLSNPPTAIPDTLGWFKASLQNWMGEAFSPQMLLRAGEAVNDAVESLWMQIVQTAISQFLGGPVQVQIAAATETQLLITIADPTVAPVVGSVGGGTLGIRRYDVTYTYVTESGSETLESPLTANTLIGSNTLCQINSPAYIAGNPDQFRAEGALGWNCYVGPTPTGGPAQRVKQNPEPLSFDVTVFIEPDSGFQFAPDGPFPPTQNTTADNIFYLRQLKVQNPPGTWTYWQQADINSTLMKAYGRTLSANSSYQIYAYDLVNGNTIKIEPATAAAVTANYFYVVKPRFLRFDNSPIPFSNIPGYTKAVRSMALSDLELSVHEYYASDSWGQKGQAASVEIAKTLAQSQRGKNNRITPYLYY